MLISSFSLLNYILSVADYNDYDCKYFTEWNIVWKLLRKFLSVIDALIHALVVYMLCKIKI